MRVRLTQIDGGKFPNLALMKMGYWHRERGDEVVLTTSVRRDLFEKSYGRVYGSVIFTRSMPLVEHLVADFPEAIVGGTGLGGEDGWGKVEHLIRAESFEYHDYSLYPDFEHSIGFSMRGCRLKCGFCVVPRKEGKPYANATLNKIWRGPGHPKNIILLDNDFFGQPRAAWEAFLDAAHDGKFRISFNQGINVRLVRDDETAQAIAAAPYYDDSFTQRRLYTAFDNVGDESIFRKGIERLLSAGIPGYHIMAYMLVGYDERETWDAVFHRLNVMLEYGIMPYPMVYQKVGESKSGNALEYRLLRLFQKWVIKRYYEILPWYEFLAEKISREDLHRMSKSLDARGVVDKKRVRRQELLAARAAPSLFGASA